MCFLRRTRRRKKTILLYSRLRARILRSFTIGRGTGDERAYSFSAIAWISGVERQDGPSLLALSRQNLPTVTQNVTDADIAKGGYVLSDCAGEAAITFIATGSEVKLALDAQAALAAEGIASRVVSMPCSNVFDRQSAEYKASVMGGCKKRIAIEAAHPDFWRKYVGLHGGVIGIDRFGESAPAGQLFELFGFTVANVVATAKAMLS